MTGSPLDVDAIRSQFPALARTEDGRQVAYLDGPGGTQTPQAVIEAMSGVLGHGVSNLGGSFGSSRDADEIMSRGRAAMADLFNARPDEISFGQNMTSITFSVSRALARRWQPGDALVLTSLDHDANFTPWVMAADDAGVEVRVAEFDPASGEMDPEAVARLLDERVRLVAVCVASNSIGTLVDVSTITDLAHEAGALTYLDAVHAGPHHLIDVQDLDCDFLAASAYKFFGPHTGILYGKLDLLADLEVYKVRPAPSDPPEKMETGTQSFESVSGVTAAVDYLAGLGAGDTRRSCLESAFSAIRAHETMLGITFLDGITDLPGVRLHGIPAMDERRVPTFAVSVSEHDPASVAAHLASRGVYVWSGHYYALNAMDRMGVLEEGGLIRIGFVHYNTLEEVQRVLEGLASA